MDGVVLSVVDGDFYADNREADQRAFFHCRAEAFFTGRNVFGRNRASFDLIDEFEIFSFDRFHHSGNASVLSRTAGLLLVSVVEVGRLGNRFAVSDLRLSDFDFGFVFPLHPFDVNVKVKFSHSLNNRLVRFGVDIGAECRVFFREAVERLRHVVSRFFVDRSNRQ